MASNYVVPIISNPATNFTEALANTAVSAMNNLGGLANPGYYFIRAVMVEATDLFDVLFQFFGSAAGNTGVPATDTQLGFVWLQQTTQYKSGGAGANRAYVGGLAIPYYDADAGTKPPALHVALLNLMPSGGSAGTKQAYPAGSIKATFWLEAMNAM